MKCLLITVLGCLLSVASSSQSLQPSLIALNGGYVKNKNGISMSWSLGEPGIQTVNTSELILSEGFQQTNLVFTTGSFDLSAEFGIKIFPNPANTLLNLESSYPGELTYNLYDLTGKRISGDRFSGHTRINLTLFRSGTYILAFREKGMPAGIYLIEKID